MSTQNFDQQQPKPTDVTDPSKKDPNQQSGQNQPKQQNPSKKDPSQVDDPRPGNEGHDQDEKRRAS